MEAFFGTDPTLSEANSLRAVGIAEGAFTFVHREASEPLWDIVADYRWSTDLINHQRGGFANNEGTVIKFIKHRDHPMIGWSTVEAIVVGGPIPTKLFVEITVDQIEEE